MNALTAASPAEIDTELATLYGEQDQVSNRINLVAGDLRRSNGERRVPTRSGYETYECSLEETLAQLNEKLANGAIESYNVAGVQRSLAALLTYQEQYAILQKQINTLAVEFERRGGWTRAFLCTNSNGHVHSSMGCSTLHIRTQVKWVITAEDREVSGMTEAEVVELAGEGACTVCYPTAPCTGPRRILDPQKETARKEREAAAAARKAKAAEKGITTPEGQPLVIQESGRSFGETIKTQRAAEVKLVDLLWWADWKNDVAREDDTQGVRQQILEALAAKKGTTVEAELAAAQKRLVARQKRDARP